MSYWSKAKKKGKLYVKRRANRMNPAWHYRRNKKWAKKAWKYNKKHDIVGLSPDNWVSPIDFVPYVNVVNKGRKGYKVYKTSKKTQKYRKRLVRGVKYSYRGGKRVVGKTTGRYSSPKSRTRRKAGTRPYYYYKGKRIYYGNNKYRKNR